jgi:hypothetical protein
MSEIRLSFPARLDCVMLRDGARAEAGHLRKDEPDPMRAFTALRQLGQHRLVEWLLRINKTLQIEAVGAWY